MWWYDGLARVFLLLLAVGFSGSLGQLNTNSNSSVCADGSTVHGSSQVPECWLILHVNQRRTARSFSLYREPAYIGECKMWRIIADGTCLPRRRGHRSSLAMLKTTSGAIHRSVRRFWPTLVNNWVYAQRYGYDMWLRTQTPPDTKTLGPRRGHFLKPLATIELLETGAYQHVFFSDMDSWFTIDQESTVRAPSLQGYLDHFGVAEKDWVFTAELVFCSCMFFARNTSSTLVFAKQWFDEGLLPYTHQHTFDQRAVIHLINRKLSGRNGWTYKEDCKHDNCQPFGHISNRGNRRVNFPWCNINHTAVHAQAQKDWGSFVGFIPQVWLQREDPRYKQNPIPQLHGCLKLWCGCIKDPSLLHHVAHYRYERFVNTIPLAWKEF